MIFIHSFTLFHYKYTQTQSPPLCKLNIPLPTNQNINTHFSLFFIHSYIKHSKKSTSQNLILYNVFILCFFLRDFQILISILISRLRKTQKENRNKEGKKIWSLVSGWGLTEKSQAEKNRRRKRRRRNLRRKRRRFPGRKWWLATPWRRRRKKAFCNLTSLPLHGNHHLSFCFNFTNVNNFLFLFFFSISLLLFWSFCLFCILLLLC